MSNKVPPLQQPSKLKSRNTYGVNLVDMSQFLPEATSRQTEVKINSSKSSSRSKSLNNNYRIRKITKITTPLKIVNKPNEMNGITIQTKRNSNNNSSFSNLGNNYVSNIHKIPTNLSSAKLPGMVSIREYPAEENKELYLRVSQNVPSPGKKQKINTSVIVKRRIEKAEKANDNSKILKSNDQDLTNKEIHEYRFLEQARVIPMTEHTESEIHTLQDTSAANSKADLITNAIEDIVTKFEDSENFNVKMIVKELDIVLEASLFDLKSAVDFTEISGVLSKVLKDEALDFQRKIKILPFMFYFCEESLFSLSLDFEEVFHSLTGFVQEIYKYKEGSQEEYRAIALKVNKACIELYKYFTQNFYVMEKDKLAIIFQNFLETFLFNIETLSGCKTLEEALLKDEQFVPFLASSNDLIPLLKMFIRKIEIRQIIHDNSIIKSKVSSLLKFITPLILESSTLFDKEAFSDNKLLSKSLVATFNSFELYLIIFKFAEMSFLQEENNENYLSPIILQFISLLNLVLTNKALLSIVLTDTRENEESLLIANSFRDLINSYKEFFDSLKLFEDKKLDFGQIVDKTNQLQKDFDNVLQGLDSKTAETIKITFGHSLRKIQKKISKALEKASD